MKYSKDPEWACPKGRHQARIVDARIIEVNEHGKKQEAIRIIAVLTSIQHPLKEYTLRLVYNQSELRKFISDFTPIIGEGEVARLFTMSAELISDGLTSLVGTAFDVETDSHLGSGHEKPWTKIVSIAPAGSLTEQFDGTA